MQRVERDAAERKQRKEMNEKKAKDLKGKGNNSFKRKEYEEAINYYTEAIKLVKDSTVLYTNRAQVYNYY